LSSAKEKHGKEKMRREKKEKKRGEEINTSKVVEVKS
jgi:hypothetical protein